MRTNLIVEARTALLGVPTRFKLLREALEGLADGRPTKRKPS